METFDVAVVGLGTAGLAVAVQAARSGLRVAGVDGAAYRFDAGASTCGSAPRPEEPVAELIASGHLRVWRSNTVPAAKTFMLCVPTPPGPYVGADLRCLLTAADAVAQRLRRDDLVLVQSTCPPGAVHRVLAARLAAASGFEPGHGFSLAYSPLRDAQAAGSWAAPRVVAGLTGRCLERATRFLRRFTPELVQLRCLLAAELTEVFENAVRLVNISLLNELAAVCREVRVDPYAVLNATSGRLVGGPGAAGSTVQVAAGMFAAAARRHGVAGQVVEAAVAVNDSMPSRVLHLVEQLLAANRAPALEDSRVLVVGVTREPELAHIGGSLAVRILEQLRPATRISYHDPRLPRLELADGAVLRSQPLASGSADVVLLLTREEAVAQAVADLGAAVVDCTTGVPRLVNPNRLHLTGPASHPIG